MRLSNNLKATVLAVLIVTGSAVSSEAENSRFALPVSVTSTLAGLFEQPVSWAQRTISQGIFGALSAVEG